MTWFGSPGFLAVAATVIAMAFFLDGWFMHTGLIVRNHRRVPHRKLRATPRRKPATGLHAPSTVPVAGPQHPTGSAAPSSVEPPASGASPSSPDAGHLPLPAVAEALTMPDGGQAPTPVGASTPDVAPTGPVVAVTTAQPRVAATARSTAA